MGMPGVGKGTQAAWLGARFGLAHLSTGDLLRQAIRSDSDLGRRVQGTLASGALVSDELMGEVLARPLQAARDGFILDGFPRTAEQVAILDRLLLNLGETLDAAFLLTASEAEIVGRLAGRRVCPQCSAVYHIKHRPPVAPGKCDACQTNLVHRPDDHEAVVLDRLRVYREQTLPVIETYRRRGLLREIDGSGDAQAVRDRLAALLEAA
jgi:adenylate kinase